jgi:glycosyltransferase involved in cell wall biosynthesis
MCKALAKRSIDIEFVLPYQADHGIDFMRVTAASPQDVQTILRSGIAYDSNKYIYKNGTEVEYDIFDQQQIYEAAVGSIVATQQYDIIHAHDWLTFRAGLRAKETLGCPLVLHVHSIEADRAGGQGGNPLVREIEDLAFHMADRIIAVSDFTRQAISQEYDVPLDKIDVVHNSLDPSDLVPVDYSLPNTYQYLAALRAQGYRVVANVGRLTVQKGLPNLLHAAKIVVEKHPKTMFLIVGSGEQYIELITLAADLGIAKNVIFTDFQRGKAWRDAYAIADLFILPSVSEPFGLTPLEAIGYGTPALISKQSGVSEILHHALKVDYWDIHEMANQIIAVMANDSLRDELLDNSSRELQRLSWGEAAEKICAVYARHGVGAAA